MKAMITGLLLILLFGSLSSSLTAFPPADIVTDTTTLPNPRSDSDRMQKIRSLAPFIDKIFTEHAKQNHIPGLAYGIVVDGKLVIYPANGQMLDNPNFTEPGPIYHMLVITGYDKDTFITNDPGTRNGFNYKYSYDTLEAANGTWDHDAHEINLSDKRIIIVSK